MPYTSPGAYWRPTATNLPPVEYPTPLGAEVLDEPGSPGGLAARRPNARGQIGRILNQRAAQHAVYSQARQAEVANSLRHGGNRPVGMSTWPTMGPGQGVGGGIPIRQGYTQPTVVAGSPMAPGPIGGGGGVSAGGGGGGVAAGGGASGGGGTLGGSFQEALDRANANNEARYQDILGGYQSRYERNLEDLKGMGAQEERDINDRYRSEEARRRQQLIGRGLGNSSVVNTMQMGNERERANDQGRLNDRLRQQRLTLDAGLSGDTLQFMERRNDTGPDLRMLAQLSQGVGQAGGGLPFGIGGGGGYQEPTVTNMGWGAGMLGGGGFNPFMFTGGGGGGSTRGPAAFARQFGNDMSQMVDNGSADGLLVSSGAFGTPQSYKDRRAAYNARNTRQGTPFVAPEISADEWLQRAIWSQQNGAGQSADQWLMNNSGG